MRTCGHRRRPEAAGLEERVGGEQHQEEGGEGEAVPDEELAGGAGAAALEERRPQGVDQVPEEEVTFPGPAEVGGGGRQEGEDRGDQAGARHSGGLLQAGQEGSHGHTLTDRVGGHHSLS